MKRNFTYLGELIHSNRKEIILSSDIVFDENDSGCIIIDVDDIVIDGNRHIIDAKSQSQIFKITARNVTIKNLIFKHGLADDGGAVLNEGEAEIVQCTFSFNEAINCGGAIANMSDLKVSECSFNINESSKGGAIANFADGEVEGCIFTDNASMIAGAVFNEGMMQIDCCTFNRNFSRLCGDAVVNNCDLMIRDSSFSGYVKDANVSKIHNFDKLTVSGCKFKVDFAENPISNDSGASLELEDNAFSDY